MTADLLDQQDVRAAMGGDGEAYGRLVARHQPRWPPTSGGLRGTAASVRNWSRKRLSRHT